MDEYRKWQGDCCMSHNSAVKVLTQIDSLILSAVVSEKNRLIVSANWIVFFFQESPLCKIIYATSTEASHIVKNLLASVLVGRNLQLWFSHDQWHLYIAWELPGGNF